MQLMNKSQVKKSFIYTWYIYPILVAVASILLLWGFEAYHLPKGYQKINIFIAGNVTNEKFKNEIQSHFDEDEVREIYYHYAEPSRNEYASKLNLYLSDTDLLILPEKNLEEFGKYLDTFFLDINEETKNNYLDKNYQYYDNEEKSYGVLLKDDSKHTWLEDYMSFEDGAFYLVLSQTSNSAGSLKNQKHDNALKAMKYILEGNNA